MLRTFTIQTLGCKVNQYESQQIHTLLTGLGLAAVRPGQKPDLTIVNTCCVTKAAAAKSRQFISKAQKLNHGSVVVAVGCLTASPQKSEQPQSFVENVYLIKNRSAIAAELNTIVQSRLYRDTAPQEPSRPIINNIRPQNGQKSKPKSTCDPLKLPELTAFAGHTRAFLKAQDGCDNYCTYCIIPIVRPRIESRPIDSICREAEQLVKSGHKEIVLTGICLGAFGRDTTRRQNWTNPETDYLAQLLEKLALTPDLHRLRISSLNPQDITPQLLDIPAKHTNIMPHLHLSLQSGSNNILKKMARLYTAEDYLEKVRMLNSCLENPAITTDIIVGFPGETESDFQQTLELCKEVGFSRIHVFSFSARRGTPAEKMSPKIKPQIIKERAAILQKIADDLAYQYRENFIGRRERILIESVENGTAAGRAERYFEVKIENPSPALKTNQIIEVTLMQNTNGSLIA
ncbi:MAG: tRNA (N(6)-L-threonylcarbamoyladenosine(37)-C(2))-methylthiotransferase MtaB [Phycisphaerae bacterium]|jgi:threonylcarbamoyladenosine tRNA methylthiotransferase MtaB